MVDVCSSEGAPGLPQHCISPAWIVPSSRTSIENDNGVHTSRLLRWDIQSDRSVTVKSVGGLQWSQVLPFVPIAVWRLGLGGGALLAGQQDGSCQYCYAVLMHPLDAPAFVPSDFGGADAADFAAARPVHYDFMSGHLMLFSAVKHYHIIFCLQGGRNSPLQGNHPPNDVPTTKSRKEAAATGGTIATGKLSRESSQGTMDSAEYGAGVLNVAPSTPRAQLLELGAVRGTSMSSSNAAMAMALDDELPPFMSPRAAVLQESAADRLLLSASPTAMASVLRSGGSRQRMSSRRRRSARISAVHELGVLPVSSSPIGAILNPSMAMGSSGATAAGYDVRARDRRRESGDPVSGRVSLGATAMSRGRLSRTGSSKSIESGSGGPGMAIGSNQRRGFGAGGRMLSGYPSQASVRPQEQGQGQVGVGGRGRQLPPASSLGLHRGRPLRRRHEPSGGTSGTRRNNRIVGMRRSGVRAFLVCVDEGRALGSLPCDQIVIHSALDAWGTIDRSDRFARSVLITGLALGGGPIHGIQMVSGTATICRLQDTSSEQLDEDETAVQLDAAVFRGSGRLERVSEVSACLGIAEWGQSFDALAAGAGSSRREDVRLLCAVQALPSTRGSTSCSNVQMVVRLYGGTHRFRSQRCSVAADPGCASMASLTAVAIVQNSDTSVLPRVMLRSAGSSEIADEASRSKAEAMHILPGNCYVQRQLALAMQLVTPSCAVAALAAIHALAERLGLIPLKQALVKLVVNSGGKRDAPQGEVVLQVEVGGLAPKDIDQIAALVVQQAVIMLSTCIKDSPAVGEQALPTNAARLAEAVARVGIVLRLSADQVHHLSQAFKAAEFAAPAESEGAAKRVQVVRVKIPKLPSGSGLALATIAFGAIESATIEQQSMALLKPVSEHLPPQATDELSAAAVALSRGSVELSPQTRLPRSVFGVHADVLESGLASYRSLHLLATDGACISPADAVLDVTHKISRAHRDLLRSSAGRFAALSDALASAACREHPPSTWPKETLELVGRHDLAYVSRFGAELPQYTGVHRPIGVGFAIATGQVESELGPATLGTNDEHLNEIVRQQGFLSAGSSGDSRDVDGLQSLPDLMSLRFPGDRRAAVVAAALQSSRAQPIVLGESDLQALQQDPTADVQALRQTRLLLMARRTCAAASGRGCLTFGTLIPSTSAGICVPPIVMHGVTRSGKKVVIDFSGVASIQYSITDLPEFLNGFAAAVRIQPAGLPASMRREWALRHIPHEASYSAGGVLMGLGVHGLLHALAATDLFEILSRRHIGLTSGCLLGLAAGARGEQDPVISRALCLHVPAILPELYQDVSLQPMVQTCALLGLGMSYEGTCHRIMAQFCLDEIGQDCRSKPLHSNEAYSLAAGIALGCIGLAKGGRQTGLREMPLVQRLRTLCWGGTDDNLNRAAHSQIDAPDTILRQPRVRLHLTAAPAVVALGLLYMRTGMPAAAEALKLPDSLESLRPVRPDVAMLRVTAHALVQWDQVDSTLDWVKEQIPWAVRRTLSLRRSVEERALAQQGGAQGGLAAVLALADGDSEDENSDDELCDPEQAKDMNPESANGGEAPPGGTAGAASEVPPSELDRLASQKRAMRRRMAKQHAQTGFAHPHEVPFGGPSADPVDLSLLDERACREIHAYCVGGAALALGLRYSGTCSHEARDTLLTLILHFESIRVKDERDLVAMRGAMALEHGEALKKQRRRRGMTSVVRQVGSEGTTVVEQDLASAIDGMPETWEGKEPSFRALARIRAQHSLVETCRGCVVLALGMVMAGTGDVTTMRCLRAARFKLSRGMDYGHHIAQQLGLGLLFLGGSRCSLARSPDATAMLLSAAMPYFPYGSGDSRFHPQPARALWACAADRRCLDLVDSRSGDAVIGTIILSVVYDRSSGAGDGQAKARPGRPPCCDGLPECSTPAAVAEEVAKAQAGLAVQSFETTSPCLLPPLHLIAGITVTDSRFYELQIFPRFNEKHARVLLAADIEMASVRTGMRREQRLSGVVAGAGGMNDPIDDVMSPAFGEDLARGAPAILCRRCMAGCSILIEPRAIKLDKRGLATAVDRIADAISGSTCRPLGSTRQQLSLAIPARELGNEDNDDDASVNRDRDPAIDLLFGSDTVGRQRVEADEEKGDQGGSLGQSGMDINPGTESDQPDVGSLKTGLRGDDVTGCVVDLQSEFLAVQAAAAAGFPALAAPIAAIVGAGEAGVAITALRRRIVVAASRARGRSTAGASAVDSRGGDSQREAALSVVCNAAVACLEAAPGRSEQNAIAADLSELDELEAFQTLQMM